MLDRVLRREVVSDELVRVDVGLGMQLFSKRKLRKPKSCRGCGAEMAVGAEAYADVTSCAMNRMHRYCVVCAEG